MPRLTNLPANVGAFLDMVAYSELGRLIGISDDGYNVIVGSTVEKPILFGSYADHPRRLIWVPRLRLYSSAAGRYQLIEKTWDWCRRELEMHDFGPENQDRAAIFLIRYRGAYDLVLAGKIEQAIYRCNLEWASLPGDRYGQGANPIEGLLSVYRSHGGTINE